MIGMRFSKPLGNVEDYAKAAQWCNKNNATIEDKGDFYEVVTIPNPTLAEIKARKLTTIAAETSAILSMERLTTSAMIVLTSRISAIPPICVSLLLPELLDFRLP